MKPDLDRLVAMDTGLPLKKVRSVTGSFLSRIMVFLTDQEDVHLDGFGQFHMTVTRGNNNVTVLRKGYPNKKNPPAPGAVRMRINRHFRVSFSKSVVFKRILREKYGPSIEEM